jgi:2-hydroxy-4-carboxymuconate semialdehyde hemiacetal dehydrogenase
MSEFGDVGVAIVGPGAIGDVHAASLARSGIDVRAIVGPIASEREQFAAQHRVLRAYADLSELLAADDIDAVIVATPSHLHAVQTCALLEAGKHVLSEIPLGLNLADALSVVECAERVGRVAMVGHTLRYWEPHRRLQQLLAEREIVPSHVVVRSVSLRQSNVGWTGRVRDWTDNLLWHHGGHAIDAALWHLRDPGTVAVAGRPGPVWPGTGTRMDIAAVLTTSDLRLATVSLSYHSRIGLGDYLVIAPDHTLLVTEGRLLLDGEVSYDAGGVAEAQSAAVVAQDLDFVRAVVHGTVPAITAAGVLPALRVLQALDDSE